MSHLLWHVLHVNFFFFNFLVFDKLVRLVGGGSVINGDTPSSGHLASVWILKGIGISTGRVYYLLVLFIGNVFLSGFVHGQLNGKWFRV